MKVIPKKPHFFKPIHPGFKYGVKIPIGFLKYLKGQEKEHAVLRRAGKKWKVKVNGRNLEEGWDKFADDHDLQLGNILVFRHEGNMEFEVVILDSSSHCDRKYAEHPQQKEAAAHVIEETSKKFEFKDDSSPRIVSSGKGFHHFELTIRSYKYLYVPRRFAKENGLANKKCGLIIRGEGRKWWNLRLFTSSSSQVYVGGKWHKFCAENDLKVGDHVRFEVVTNGENPIWKFHVMVKSVLEPASTSADDDINPHFISTIKPYTSIHPVLFLPKAFVKANGLMNKKEMTLLDGKRRPWPVQLKRMGRCFGIKREGWTRFMKANGVQVGDTYKFELINNGTIPTVYFHCKYSGKDVQLNINDDQESTDKKMKQFEASEL